MSKRKPNNMARRANALSATLIKGMAITWVASDKTDGVALSEAWHIKSGRRVNVQASLYRAFTETKTNWQIYCAVFCRDQTNEQYVQGIWIKTNERYCQADLADYLNEAHTTLWNEANANHKMNLGWVAYPDTIERSDEDAIALLEKRDCWQVLAPWEAVA